MTVEQMMAEVYKQSRIANTANANIQALEKAIAEAEKVSPETVTATTEAPVDEKTKTSSK